MPDSVEDSGKIAQAVASATTRGFHFTWRLVALAGVLVILLVSYTSSLRVYFNQQAQLAATRAQLQAAQQSIDDLQDQLARWQDPAYVKAQARERLGWVVPGEIGFQVIGADGKPLGAGSAIGASSNPSAGQQPQTWWDRLTGSAAAADDPTPVAQSAPSGTSTVTINTTPTVSPSTPGPASESPR